MPARNPLDEKSIEALVALVDEMGDTKIVLSPGHRLVLWLGRCVRLRLGSDDDRRHRGDLEE